MRKRVQSLVSAGVLVVLVTSSYAAQSWNVKMKALSETLESLMSDVYSDEVYKNPKNFKRIEENAKKLAKMAHELPKNAKEGVVQAPTDADLSVGLIASLFQDEASRAVQEFKRGHRDYARTVLKTLPTFCIGCHTRSVGGGPPLKMNSKAVKLFSSIEKAEFLAGARQFDEALEEFDKILSNKDYAKKRSLDWERSLRDALAIAVRVKKDPDQALKIIQKVIDAPDSFGVPKFLKDDAKVWKESVDDWKKEHKPQALTEEGLFAEGQRLLGKIKEVQQFAADRSADIYYLRLSATMHDLLKVAPKGSRAGEALLLLGVSYEALRDLDLWDLHDLYYESCVRRYAHQSIAGVCYKRLEQSLYSGYSGTSGSALPRDVQEKLSELQKLAEIRKL